MLTSSNVPRYLRFARILALASSAAAVSCGPVTRPGPITISDGVTVGDSATLATCPATLPTFASSCDPGLACDYPGYTCYNSPLTIRCQCTANDGGSGQWFCGLCEGPLPPPEFPHGADAV